MPTQHDVDDVRSRMRREFLKAWGVKEIPTYPPFQYGEPEAEITTTTEGTHPTSP